MDIGAQTNPLQVFNEWMAEAKAHPHIKEATAMAVATVAKSGEVHNRVVLCKEWSKEGFVFFTNYDSQKGVDLAAHPYAGAVFYWDPLFKQVKICGPVEKTKREASVEYWNSRPRASQLSQWISHQSREAPERDVIEAQWQQAERQFEGKPIPCPEHWGGYILRPKTMELWIGRPGRLHDRHQFHGSGLDRWTYRRLYP